MEWTDVNFEAKTVSVNSPEKNSNPRILKLSQQTLTMLQNLPKKGERIFGYSKTRRDSLFCHQRKRLAKKLDNPRLNRITFHTIRHWKGTIEYHKTKDILHVQRILGHKSVQNTMVYIQLEKTLFKQTDDQFTVKVAETVEDTCKLLEVGFEYVCDMEGKKLFRKRK